MLPQILSATAARRNLEEILRRVLENKERFMITWHGEPNAVIMHLGEYSRAFGRPLGRRTRQTRNPKLSMG
ncbi:MAG: hypothetical protein DMG40_19480 [Acidobacteria bacterium]|nr:MAG: hypothetical protein DMG40_19480 [Acidobacteriota bacterium]